MDFECFTETVSQFQYDEVKVIGKTVEIEGRPCHIIALLRQGEQAQICMLTQEDAVPQALMRETKTMRESLKGRTGTQMPGLQKIKIGNTVLETEGGTGYCMQASVTDTAVLTLKLMEAGWQLPHDNAFWEMDWEQVTMTIDRFRGTYKLLPDVDGAQISVTWGPQFLEYMVEKPVTLTVSDEQEGVRGGQELPFTMTGADGSIKEGICYINHVALIDVWKEQEARYADPEYQKQALEHVTPEAFEEIKKQSFRILEQDCPRGMCYVGVEYECTLDVSLDIYSKEYLDSVPKVYEGSAAFMLISHRTDKETGTHGLKMRAAAVQTPVPPDTKEIRAELFQARMMIPEWEEKL